MPFLIIGSVLLSQVDYSTQIQSIFDSNCTGCHGSSGGLNLDEGSSYGNLVNEVSNNYAPALRVIPEDAVNSVLWNKVAGTGNFGNQMPPSGQLTQDEIDLIESWINEGANEIPLSISSEALTSPGKIRILSNYPNPFNPSTTLSWMQEKPEKLDLYIYSVPGQLVEHITMGEYSGGYNQFVWQPENLSSGIYFLTLQGNTFSTQHKIIYSK